MKIAFTCYKGISWTSKLIKFWTRGDYSHIGYITNYHTYRKNPEEWEFIEAWKFKNRPYFRWDYSDWFLHTPNTSVEIYELDVNYKVFSKIDAFLRQLAGSKTLYDWLGILGFVLKNDDSKDKYFCSEGCIVALYKGGVIPRIRFSTIDPSDFVDIIKILGFKKTYDIMVRENGFEVISAYI